MSWDRADIYRHIDNERANQAQQWANPHPWGQGDCSSDKVPDIAKVAVLTEETGEVARAVLDGENIGTLRGELIQVAAVAVAWLESL